MDRGLELIERMLEGDRLALARLITVGVTGPPGAGKSTLVDGVTGLLRKAGASVGIVAVDPTSPFTGGAVLGDRIRMQTHALDPDVFIRSMATRGSLGGLARATSEVLKLLDAFGFGWILVETVGVGQTELDVIKLADTTVVVLVPESGDAIQTMKAGLLEAADLLVVNKADREGAPALVAELRFMVHLHRGAAGSAAEPRWEVPILTTTATTGDGLPEVVAAIGQHRRVLEDSGQLAARRQARRARELHDLMLAELRREVEGALADGGPLGALVADVEAGRVDPYTAIAEIRQRFGGFTR
jgi:LAO/AO transport system kinase